jgi:hypothetical protein
LDARVQQVGVQMALASAVSLAALAGLRQRFADYRPDLHAMVTRPDTRAMEWIRVNTPPDARFVVSDFAAYGGGLIVGSDAGWWLPLLAHRLTTLPPMPYGTEQSGVRADYREFVNLQTKLTQAYGLERSEVREFLLGQGVTYVFIGQRQGRVGNPSETWLKVEALLISPHYELLYNRDHVYVFRMLH